MFSQISAPSKRASARWINLKGFSVIIVSSCYRGTCGAAPFFMNNFSVIFLSTSLERRWSSVENIRQESRSWGWPTSVLLFLRFSFTLQTSASKRWASQRPLSTLSSHCQKVCVFWVIAQRSTQLIAYVCITHKKSNICHSSCDVKTVMFTYDYHIVYVCIWESKLNDICRQRCSPTSTRTLSWLEETRCYQGSESVWRQSFDPSFRPTSLCQSCFLQSKLLKPIRQVKERFLQL